MTALTISAFSRGIVVEGSADARRTDELEECDGYDIGERGQLVAASDITAFANAIGSGAAALSLVRQIDVLAVPQNPQLVAVGNSGSDTWGALVTPNGASTTAAQIGATHAAGFNVTMAPFPYVSPDGDQLRVMLIAVAARAAYDPLAGLGLFAVTFDPSGGFSIQPISVYDALGTGTSGSFPTGDKSQQLYPRGVLAYNSHALIWGLDSHDTSKGDGPNRVMFSNIGNPLKWGFDTGEQAILDGTDEESNREFEDSDAFTIGGGGEVIRAGVVWDRRAWFGTSEGLHFLEGYGRESFKTNGAAAVAQSHNVIGPHAMIEGPDRLLHGVGDAGHWIFDGSRVDSVGNRLRRFDTKSNGFWDLIWTDTSRTLASFPGQTNQDLVWMMSDADLSQVWIGIPFCSASAGYGFGNDTVVIKYHVATGGYSRQVFTGQTILSAAFFKRGHIADTQRFMAGTSLVTTNINVYRRKTTPAASPVMPTTLPKVATSEYALHGVVGTGLSDKVYLVLAWETTSALPLVLSVTPTIDGKALRTIILTIGDTVPSSPSDGDVWLDTSGSDTNLGNGTAGDLIPASADDYILRTYVASWAKWVLVPASIGQGLRVSIPIAHDVARGTRVKVRIVTTAAGGRFEIEGLGFNPSTVRSDQ